MDEKIVKCDDAKEAPELIFNGEHLKEDYEYSRQTLLEIIEQGKTAIGDALLIAQASEQPRAFEVLSNLIKTVGDVSDKFLNLQEKLKNIESKEREVKEYIEHTTNNNSLFVGSTSELFEALFDKKNNQMLENENTSK